MSLRITQLRQLHKDVQVAYCLLMVGVVIGGCFFLRHYFDYKVIALILLMVISLIAMLFDMVPVIISAVVSAFTWNFFFIPPLYTLHIGNAEDTLMFFLYFFIALVNTVLTVKIRDAEDKARDKEESERALLLYNTILNSLSHELRTPLATIIGAVDTLREDQQNPAPEKATILMDEIEKASFRLNEQVENLLNIGRIESGVLKPYNDWVDVGEIVYKIKNRVQQDTLRGIVYDDKEDIPLFKLDGIMLEQVLYNLVINAAKHTPADTLIQINVTAGQEQCRISVSDKGPGFSNTEAGNIFDKFYKVHHEKPGGLGLGLSIVKGFVQAMQGDVKVASIPGEGTTFTVLIPAETSYIGRLKNE